MFSWCLNHSHTLQLPIATELKELKYFQRTFCALLAFHFMYSEIIPVSEAFKSFCDPELTWGTIYTDLSSEMGGSSAFVLSKANDLNSMARYCND